MRNTSRLLLLLSTAATVSVAQRTETASPATAISIPSSIQSTTGGATTTDVPLSLWDVANSLLASHYPSTSLDGVATLTWPSTVVIGGTTYNAHSLSDAIATPTSLSTHGVAVSPTPTSTDSARMDGEKSGDAFGDKKLGIILGCVIGLVTLVLVGVVFCCLKRRKDDTGSFFMRRRTPSIASSDIRSWLPRSRPDTFGNTTYVSAGNPNLNSEPWNKQPPVAVRPSMSEPRISQHPAFAAARLHGSSRSTSEDNPFYTPAERVDAQPRYNADLERGRYDPHPVELGHDEAPRRRSSDSLRASGDRPPTPFSPMEMMGFGAPRAEPLSKVDRQDYGQDPVMQSHRPFNNPFSSPEDEEDDMVSPILPSKSPDRRYSPMVHYPSWSEVSEFDFNGDGRQRLRNVSSGETDGGDGWHPVRERTDGRYELA